MKIRTGDTVKVISGKDKGKTGKVLRVLPSLARVVVENVNIHTKYEKSRGPRQRTSQKITTASPLPVSKVMLVDSSGKPTRVGYQILDNGTKQRIGKASGKAV